MSSPNSKRIAAGMLLAILAVTVARAQDDGSQVDLRKAGAAKRADAPSRNHTPENRLRCWQYGRLIFDSHVAAPVAKSGTVTELRAGPGRAIQLMDMNHGLCIAETAAR